MDEILLASTALSTSHGGPAIPAVLRAFSDARRFDLLYGPVMFVLGSVDIRLFGLSIIGWRLIGWLGAVVITVAAAWIAGSLGSSKASTALCAALVALSQGIGARATSGRLDTIAVAIQVLTLGCAIRAFDRKYRDFATNLFAALTGLLCALGALTTPRLFPFLLGLALAIVVETLRGQPSGLRRFVRVGVTAVMASLPVLFWLHQAGIGSVDWVRYTFEVSRGDRINVSPLLGGAWHLTDGPLLTRLSGAAGLTLTLVSLSTLFFLRTTGSPFAAEGRWSRLRFALTVALANYLFTLLLIARFWDYEIFVIPLLLPVLVVITQELFRAVPALTVRTGLVMATWLLFAMLLTGIRAGKTLGWLGAFHLRDPLPLQRFVAENVPSNSVVFGPADLYFYAVQLAGSKYLYAQPVAAPGIFTTASSQPDWRRELKSETAFLIWPAADTLPTGIPQDRLTRVAHFDPAPVQRQLLPIGVWNEGYPQTNLYRISLHTNQKGAVEPGAP